MSGGFRFDGIDIADLGLEYAPDNQNTYVYQPGIYKIHEQIIDAHDGGYYYGDTMQPKEFNLRCIYEDKHITSGVMEKMHMLFRRGRTGKLIFDRRSWCWYVATVVNVDTKQMTNYQNGVITVKMKAYYPYARCDYTVMPNNEYKQSLENSTGLLYNWEPETSFTNITQQTSLFLYNPGTERAKVSIQIAGDVGTGLTISNRTTEQQCKFVAITNTVCENNYYVQCDGLNGQTILTNGTITKPGFLYHDYGFIELEPGYPAYRDVLINVPSNGTTVKSDGLFTPDMLHRHIIFYDGTIRRIERVEDENTVYVNNSVNTGSSYAQIALLNEIEVSGDINLTKLNFIYKPTFA